MKSGETEFTPERSALWAAGGAIAATYFYFLIYAEFALIELAKPLIGAEQWRLRGLVFFLGAGGLVGSAWAARRFSVIDLQARLSWSFRGCAAGAALAVASGSFPFLLFAAAVSGVALGALTVNLAASLRPVIGTSRLGWVIGVGTGVAYALCNVPWIFENNAQMQTVLAALLAASASVLSPFLLPQEPSVSKESEYRPAGLARWVIVLMALVWLDSTVFYVVQHQPVLKDSAWSGSGRLWLNALTHLTLALFAGWWLDRGARARVVLIALALLAGGCFAINGGRGYGALLYTGGVSLYSVVLIYVPARSGRAWQAAVIYGVAGWIGSAAGIGYAQGLDHIPRSLPLAAALVILILLAGRWRARAVAVVAGCGLLGSGFGTNEASAAAFDPIPTSRDALIRRGREVYVAEGCIHCHSQYLRPSVPSENEEASAMPTTDAGSPPLFGNRRQGPDLTAIGARLPVAEWQREHLIDPRRLRPGSRMPSYAYLFAPGDLRGDALVAYLLSLGKEPK